MAQAGTIRIEASSHRTLRQLSERMGQSMQAVLAKAIDELRRKQMFAEANAVFAAIKQEELEERMLWEATLSDGLDENETWEDDDGVPR